jgi:K+-transporting ATPase ATPase A chain
MVGRTPEYLGKKIEAYEMKMAALVLLIPPFYNTALGIAMWASRYWLMIPVLAIAGSLAAKRATAVTAGTLPTHGPLFVAMLVGVVLIVGALTFVPALALGPIVEHLLLVGRG